MTSPLETYQKAAREALKAHEQELVVGLTHGTLKALTTAALDLARAVGREAIGSPHNDDTGRVSAEKLFQLARLERVVGGVTNDRII